MFGGTTAVRMRVLGHLAGVRGVEEECLMGWWEWRIVRWSCVASV